MLRKTTMGILLGLIGIISCRKTPDYDQLSSNFVVNTSYDTAINFHNFKTFYISDTIAYYSSDPNNTDTILYDSVAQQLVGTVLQRMEQYGYTLVGKGSNPDLGLNLGLVKNVSAGVIYPGWWDGWPGWWYPPYWGWDYPYYYPWSYVYYITTGSVVLDMVDLKDASDDRKLEVLWNATSAGGLTSNSNSNLTLAKQALNQAFIQSPYLDQQN